MLTPNADYRADPNRAIHIHGLIEQDLVDGLTPTILSLVHASRKPITVYIDSRGGSPISVEALRRLLTAPDQDGSPPCRIITVATARAASAAADFLSSGDYAIAYPDASILYHGVRTSPRAPVTVEAASYLTEYLKFGNDQFAMALAARSNWRLVLRYVSMKSAFDEYKAKAQQLAPDDFECFLAMISEKLSPTGIKVMNRAKDRNIRYADVSSSVMRAAVKQARFKNAKRPADVESVLLKGIIDYQLKKNRGTAWTFRDGGLTQVGDDFFLLREYFSNYESTHLSQLCARYSNFFLTQNDHAEIEKLPADAQETAQRDKVVPQIRPIWVFFVALCHALQEGEDWELTATDAFWLGLIDEVLGVQDLPTLRILIESQPTSSTTTAPTIKHELHYGPQTKTR